MYLLCYLIVVLYSSYIVHGSFLSEVLFQTTTDNPEDWTGRWFPERPSTPAPVSSENEINRNMGVHDECDDGKTNLEKDYNGDYNAYLCMNSRMRLWPSRDTRPILEYENIPKLYSAQHLCMNESIYYNSDVPTFGTHRQLWPVYGEYIYLPPQRWIHSLEHGAIVGLYHPCADPREIASFKKSIEGCLWRHILTPHSILPEDMPFAVVAWGVKLRMAHSSRSAIRNFIQENALRGPEKVSRDGQFNEYLVRPAKMRSDSEDSDLCPGALAHD